MFACWADNCVIEGDKGLQHTLGFAGERGVGAWETAVGVWLRSMRSPGLGITIISDIDC